MALSEDGHYLRLAAKNALLSPDPSTQNGSLLLYPIKGTWDKYGHLNGHNRPAVATDLKAVDRDVKNKVISHAEVVPLFGAAKLGIPTELSTLYCIWIACVGCAKTIVECGVRRVVGSQRLYDITPDRWRKEVEDGLDILRQGSVEVNFCPDVLGVDILFNGEKVSI
jgi:deoxycytidylate deaminase